MKEQILDRTDRGLHIFNYYMPFEFKPKKNFKNPLYADSKGSCNIYFDGRSNCYKMHDFGNIDFSGDCFWFVATLNKLDVCRDFVEVMQIINKDLCLDINRSYNHTVNKVVNTSTTQIKTESKNRNNKIVSEPSPIIAKPYKAVEKIYSEDELSYWLQYGITLKELNKYNVKSLSWYQGKNNSGEKFKISSSQAEPIFAYSAKDYIKLYRPKSRKMKFLYGGQMPDIYCFGLEQLTQRGDIIFITSGEKDVLALSSRGFNAICFNSETANIDKEMIEMLARRFRHVIFLYDMDETGKRESSRQCEVFASYKTIRLDLPLSGTKEEKDISDYFRLGNSEEDLLF